MIRPMLALVAIGLGMLVACAVLPQPTLPSRVEEAIARTQVTVSAPQAGDVPALGQGEALAAAGTAARQNRWESPLEAPALARLDSLGAIEGIDAEDHRLVWIVTSFDGRAEFVLVISGTDGSVIASQITGIEPP